MGSTYQIQIYWGKYINTLRKSCNLNLYIWYWIYSANNWGIYVHLGVSLRPSGVGLQNVLCVCKSHLFPGERKSV